MNFGQLKTAVFSALDEHGIEDISIFDFGEGMNSAQLQLLGMLPVEAIPEFMVTRYIDPSAAVVTEGSVQIPERFFSLEFVQYARDGTRAQDGTVVRTTARIVSPTEFELLSSFETQEQVASVTGQLVRFWPQPEAAGDPGEPKSIKMVYKMRPRPYMGVTRWQTNGSFLSLNQHADSPRVFNVLAWDNGPRTLDGIGVGTTDDVLGGRIFVGPEVNTTRENRNLYECTIVDCFLDDTDVIVIVVSDDDEVPIPEEVSGVVRYQPSLLLPRQTGEVGGSILSDQDFPEFNQKWHQHLVDLTVARILMSRRRYNEAGARYQLVSQKLQAMGVEIFFSIPEVPSEEGRSR